ncbi:MAG: hypothetical protein ACPL4K_01565, partial [Candidatus Margulisiibacteriota bacterium]
MENNELELIKNSLPKLYQNLKEHNFLQGEVFNEIFIEEVQALKTYLTQLKKQFDDFDNFSPTRQEKIDYINNHKYEIFNKLNTFFVRIWNFVEKLSSQEYRIYQLYIQKELYRLLGLTPFNRYIYEKPLGYPGDYIMMNYLYEDGYVGTTTFEKLIHRYTCSTPMARANINRKDYFKRHIKEILISSDGNAKIASIACGPAREAIEIISEEEKALNSTFTFFDFEPRALKFIDEEIKKIEGRRVNVVFINENITS